MKISELQAIEKELLDGLRNRAKAGDNAAAQVALQHLRETSKHIEEWRKSKDAERPQVTLKPPEPVIFEGEEVPCNGQS